jgi:arylsulfatase A-like enzyme
MVNSSNQEIPLRKSFWKVFRLIFVIFSLYLLGDAFYRWDGFRQYATFSEFIPSIALASLLWSISALIFSIVAWSILQSFKWLCNKIKIIIEIDHLLITIGIFVIIGILVWEVKKLFWSDLQTTAQTKISVLISVIIISIVLTWMFRNKTGKWLRIVHERITPLVWLFGGVVFISIPLVSYHIIFKDTHKVISDTSKVVTQKVTGPSVPDKNRPNILLVTFDALAAGDMSTYGYQRPTTPFITEWAKKATLFTNLEAASNWTTSSTASLMTGKRLWTHMAANIDGTPPIKSNIESLPLVLKKNGYFNIALITNRHAGADRLGITDGFDIVVPFTEFMSTEALFGEDGFMEQLLYKLFADKIKLYNWITQGDFILSELESTYYRYVKRTTHSSVKPPSAVFARFLDTLDNNPASPFFAWIHIFQPHDPYLPPAPYSGLFDSSLEFRDMWSQRPIKLKTNVLLYKHLPYPPEMQPTMDILRSIYDEYIRYCDNEFEGFIKQLTVSNRTRNTIIIMSSDHGESFEKGYYQHNGPFLYETVTHVPLIIKKPGQNEGQIIHDVIEQVDITATILNLAGISAPSWIEGRSFEPLMKGESLPPKYVFSMNLISNSTRDHIIKKGSFAVWKGDYKAIYDLDKEKALLYNLREDLGEIHDIFEKEPEKGQELLDVIHENLETANKRLKAEQADLK